eukprot:TRINITY_DN180_c0_g1_i1.p1 TRINITY_DN180_c0_g1~~TRINITY_DN180_c0_g1_i1.p1  ORF type:complete len:488 (-),score=164.78 TRINITY_DN180_c0_g1_i1:244-1707(-)
MSSSNRSQTQTALATNKNAILFRTEEQRASNIMFDRRVVRGITTTKKPVLTAEQSEFVKKEARKNASDAIRQRRERKEALISSGKIRPPLHSIQQMHDEIKLPKIRTEVPLHLYLEEQKEALLVDEESTQTDAFVERPPSPPFIPRKNGIDEGTQVETELVFQYDRDVVPIVEVVVQTVLEQSLIEVRDEEKMRFLRNSKNHLDEKWSREKEDIRKKEAEERALLKAKEGLLKQSSEQAKREFALRTKLQSVHFAHTYLSSLQQESFTQLKKSGFFFDPIHYQSETYLPSVYKETRSNLVHATQAKSMIDSLLKKSIETISSVRVSTENERKRAEEKALQEEKERKKKEEELKKRKMIISLYLHSEAVSKEPVGPIRLSAESTVSDVENHVLAWMQEHITNPPERSQLRFLWTGKELDPTKTLYDLGIESLSTLQMRVEKSATTVASSSSSSSSETAAATTNDQLQDDQQQQPEFNEEENDDDSRDA